MPKAVKTGLTITICTTILLAILFVYLQKNVLFDGICDYSIKDGSIHTGITENSNEYEFENGILVVDVIGCLEKVHVKNNGNYILRVVFADQIIKVRNFIFEIENKKDFVLCNGPTCLTINTLKDLNNSLILDKNIKLTIVVSKDGDKDYNIFMDKFLNALVKNNRFPIIARKIYVVGIGT